MTDAARHEGRRMRDRAARSMRALNESESVHYRDELRAARYAALADAEGFSAICFALEALGLRLLGRQADLSGYEQRIAAYAKCSPVLTELAMRWPTRFKDFHALYRVVRTARNDAMHIGAYARHATDAAIELCIGLEEGLMATMPRTVGNLMVKSPVIVESWQPIAHARQLMLMHSFSFLPVRVNKQWSLLSEVALAKFLNVPRDERFDRLGLTIAEGIEKLGMELISVSEQELLSAKTLVDDVLSRAVVAAGPALWLVVDEDHEGHLAGVLSPFELM